MGWDSKEQGGVVRGVTAMAIGEGTERAGNQSQSESHTLDSGCIFAGFMRHA